MQIFSNLISNSIKYSSQERDLMIRIGYQEKPNTHVFSVKDNGMGIQKEYLDNIFDIFFRRTKATQRAPASASPS